MKVLPVAFSRVDPPPVRGGHALLGTDAAAAMARRGISPKTFPDGTVFTVTFFPLRDGRPFGAMTGEFIKCGATMPAGGCTKDTGEVLSYPYRTPIPSGGTYEPGTTVGTPSSHRSNLQTQYNEILSQIDALARDASYNGINLLNGDNLKVVFNEDGTSSQTITGVTFSSTGLGLDTLSASEFQSNSAIDTVLSNVDAALSTLRSQAAKFGSNLTTVQTRQDFTKNMINTLQTGADALVLADTNEEGANLLALQTRQQLSTTALSLSAQADQAVLRLF